MNKESIRWGIVGPGNIARSFAKDLQLVDDAVLQAVGSRSVDNARAFADEFNVPNVHASYNEVFEDPEVDIVYIATPHNSHSELTIQALYHGKHVLCEKPLAVNLRQIQAIKEAASRNDVFIMEAFWSRFNPSIRETIDRVKNGDLGEVNYINADFTFFRDAPAESRLYNMDLAGGSILDVGVYPIFLAYSIMGMPDQIIARGKLHETGADKQMSAILEYPHGFAVIMSGFRSKSDMVAKVCGTKGSIFIDTTWHEAQQYRFLNAETGEEKVHELPTLGKGFSHEIEECIKCIRAGENQSSLWSLNDSEKIISITDEIRDQLGVIYPFE